MSQPVACLFIRTDSVYKTLDNTDCYDIDRDAKKYCGGMPVVAHPPCRAWGAFSWNAKPREGERELATWAVEQVRANGGVLEHPKASKLWQEAGLPKGKQVDEYGGFTLSVDQFWWGHKARKRTNLYVCGISRADVPEIPMRFDAVTHYVAFPKGYKGPMKEITRSEREYTPPDFAKWLVELASRCKKPGKNKS